MESSATNKTFGSSRFDKSESNDKPLNDAKMIEKSNISATYIHYPNTHNIGSEFKKLANF